MAESGDFFSASVELGERETLDVDALRLLFKLECSGEDFYNQLADRIGDDRAAELLRRNAREELGHARRVQRAITLKLGEEFEPAADDLERFPIPLPDTIGRDLLPVIVQAELDGDAGYQRWADAESDDAVARLLRLNGREETIHGERVQAVMEILGGPVAS